MEWVKLLFVECHRAIREGELIKRASQRDKEFHFQDWFKARLNFLGAHFDEPSRNSYPDFRMVDSPLGFEIKGLQHPGRIANYDCNSQVPTGYHNGRHIYYVFGRYPKEPMDLNEYPVFDLVICHGDFLNADHDYVHKNRSIKGFGSYGDLLIRDRKMYVAPTPFALTHGTEGQITLIVPEVVDFSEELTEVALLTRQEADELTIGYDFDLTTNSLESRTIPNPHAGMKHSFRVYRVSTEHGPDVSLREHSE